MQVNCDNCGKCCIGEIPKDWGIGKLRESTNMEDVSGTNRVSLSLDEIKKFCNESLCGAMEILGVVKPDPKKFGYETSRKVTYLYYGLRTYPKKIDGDWKLACVFFDPKLKKCRIHNSELYPLLCKVYPFATFYKDEKPICKPELVTGSLTEEQNKQCKEYFDVFSKPQVISIKMNYDEFTQFYENHKDQIELCIDLLQRAFKITDINPHQKYKKMIDAVDKEIKDYKDNW